MVCSLSILLSFPLRFLNSDVKFLKLIQSFEDEFEDYLMQMNLFSHSPGCFELCCILSCNHYCTSLHLTVCNIWVPFGHNGHLDSHPQTSLPPASWMESFNPPSLQSRTDCWPAVHQHSFLCEGQMEAIAESVGPGPVLPGDPQVAIKSNVPLNEGQ